MSLNYDTAKQFEDIARILIDKEREHFGLSHVESEAGQVPTQCDYKYNVEIVAYAKETSKFVLFEVRKRNRNVTPADAGEFAYRLLISTSNNGSKGRLLRNAA